MTHRLTQNEPRWRARMSKPQNLALWAPNSTLLGRLRVQGFRFRGLGVQGFRFRGLGFRGLGV